MLLLLPLLIACQISDPLDTEPRDSGDSGDTGHQVVTGELPGTTQRGSAERVTSPSTADVPTLGAENADFSLDILRSLLAGQTANLVMSPWSLQTVMAQVYAGADGDAKTAIGSTFRWTLPDAQLHEAFDATALALEAHDAPSADPPLALTTVSQIFVSEGYPLGAAWLDTLSAYYGTGVQVMNFEADPPGVAADINAWIATRTGDHIKDLISSELVADSRLLLVNALYLKASWDVPFLEASTSDAPFTRADGTVVSAPTMSGSVNVRGAAGDGFFVADLPFSDHALTMTIVLPDEGRFAEVTGSLEWSTVQAVIDAEEFCGECSVALPKYEVHSAPDVQGAMEAMGMGPAFGGAYPGINEFLSLTGVQQQAFVLVNEIGTEAAAATEASFTDSGSVPPFGPVVIDRPFLWFVRETQTGAVLFAGVIVDPTAK